ncbi:MAG: cyclic peptide transporter [Pedosphaera sp.]|nr:cyclic peptide transporter [Pedosphaera sp.]
MNLLKFVFRTCRGMITITTVIALVSGACNAGLIALVNSVLNHTRHSMGWLVACFATLTVARLISNFASQVLLVHYAQGAVSNLRRDLVRKILSVPLRQLEEIGSPGILVALTDDVFNITQALLGIPIITVNVAILIGGAAYLGWLSWEVLLGMMGLILVGVVSYRLLMKSAFRFLHLAREEEDRLYRQFRALTEGIKELKLHRNRRKSFMADNVQNSTEAFQKYNIAAEYRFVLAQNWSHLLFYVLVGLILFLLPAMQTISMQALTGYVITILYLMGPLAGVMSSFSLFGRANVALQKVEKLGVSLGASQIEDGAVHAPQGELPFKKLELLDIVHSYRHEREDANFVLGPMSLSFSPGELVFLVGGNGSGKSTLAKIITGLYFPEAGEIRLNGELIGTHNRDDYRQLFSALFSDFYLFDNLLGINAPNLDDRAREYLDQFHLSHKVKVENGNLSTTAVSQGQRKRLALMTVYLEDRPIYLFDEWASDQDPQFKAVFYTELLPELKARGKTVIVITHDDKYFYIADRIIKLDYGRVDRPKPVNGEALDSILQAAH